MPPQPQIDLRSSAEAWPDQDMELRAEGDGMTFRGYAAVFNSLSEDLGGRVRLHAVRSPPRPGAEWHCCAGSRR